MAKIKTDDKCSMSGNSCKTETKCRGDSALSSVISSIPKKTRSDYAKLPKNVLDNEMSHSQNPVKDAGMPRARENRTSSSRSILQKITKNKVAEVEKGIFTTKVRGGKDMVLTSRPGSTVKSEVASSKLLVKNDSSQHCSDEEQSTFKRLKPVSLPAVHIQRLNNTEPAWFSLSDSDKHNVERKEATTVLTNTAATDLPEGQGKSCHVSNSRQFREIGLSVKVEPDSHSALAVDNENPEAYRIKQENDFDDGRAQVTDGGAKLNEKATGVVVPLLTKCGEESKYTKLSTDGSRCCNASGEGLAENKQSNVIAKNPLASDDDDVVVLSVDSSRSKIARKSRSDVNRKRSGTDDDGGCTLTMHIKREPGTEDATTAETVAQESVEDDERACNRGTPNKVARTSSKNVGAKSAKTRPTKSKQSTCTGSRVSMSVLTRSMIKIPG